MSKELPLPSAQEVEDLLKSIESTSALVAVNSTIVSETIESIDKRLARLPGKIPVTISAGNVQVGFDRIGREWGLTIVDSCTEDGEPIEDELASASIERKARALPLVFALLPRILHEQNRQLASLKDAAKLANEYRRAEKGAK